MEKKDKKKLSSEDIQNLISESDQFKKLPSFKLFGHTWDVQSTIVAGISIVTWIILFFAFKVFGIIKYAPAFFIIYILIVLLNLYNSANDVPDVEAERLQISSQQSFIQGGIAVFILAFVFLYNIKMEDTQKTLVYKVLIMSLLVSSLGIIIVNVKNDSVNIRFTRKCQQMLYNQGLVLFLLGLYMIYYFQDK